MAPQQIGPLDNSAHTIAFDHSRTWFCSTPKILVAVTGIGLHEKIRATLDHESQPLETRMSTLIEEMRSAEDRGRQRARERRKREAQERLAEIPDMLVKWLGVVRIDGFEERDTETPQWSDVLSERPETRGPKLLKEHEATLREAADIATRVFDAQLSIVQKDDEV